MSEGRSIPRSRHDRLSDTGPDRSTAIHVLRRPSSSQVPSTSSPSGVSRSRTTAQACCDITLVVLPEHVEGAHDGGLLPDVQGDLETAEPERESFPLQRFAERDPVGLDLDPHDLDVGPDPPQPIVQLDRGHG